MADRFMLIPERVYERLSVAEQKLAQLGDENDNMCASDVASAENAGANANRQIQILHMQDAPPASNNKTREMDERIDEVVSLLPKNYRSKSRLIMYALRPHLHLEPSNQVRFDDGDVGDSLIDYLRYFTSPSYMNGYEPVMVQKFAQLMLTAAVPQSAMGPGRMLSRIASMRGTRRRRTTQMRPTVRPSAPIAHDNLLPSATAATATATDTQPPGMQTSMWTKLFI